MGRYYNGDIEGKFWFAVQSSTAADRFGKVYAETGYVEYYYEIADLPKVESEIKLIEESIGKDNLKAINYFFLNKRKTMKESGLSDGLWNKHKSDYADLILGIKIRDCIIDNGECSFTAEL